jgi:hypothetical protein
VTGTVLGVAAASTAATASVDVGRTTAAARCGTCPASDQCNASGHQSRLASAWRRVVTVHAPEAELVESVGQSVGERTGFSPNRLAVPVSSIGGVGRVISGALRHGRAMRGGSLLGIAQRR